ncbi:Crp/Fnr family transcriptional regulator [Flavobacterium limi]|uniref:cAMP-binding protein n=1 Tax=Flavobacterium limi TaxID=2045105 RepID=A0ABQ1URE0_9FLAO|nr:Crp/Fnr family transcriptional regulator [Flavobacterium limi]GGF24080.1 cAMP-binding protein [Flavobacterium limi]
MEKLKSVLGFGGILTTAAIDEIALLFEKNYFKANEIIQDANKISNRVGFVENGIVRVYATDKEGLEVTKYFVRENQFFVDLESYYTSTVNKDAFQAVVNTEAFSITKETLDELSERVPNFYIFLKSITEAHLLNKIKDNDFLNYGNAKTKYLEFMSRYPSLAQNVPQHYIASYLKITPQSLSRLRNQIVKNR